MFKSRRVQALILIVEVIIILSMLAYFIVPSTTPLESTIIPETTAEPTSLVTPVPTPTIAPTPTIIPTPTPAPLPTTMYLHQISVGCANAYLIQYGKDFIVIDGGLGDSDTRNHVFEYLEKAGVDKLTAYICTHLHGDHVGNTERILKHFANEKTIVYGPMEEWWGWISNYGKKVDSSIGNCKYIQFKAGDTINFGNLQLTCVGPSSVDHKGVENKDSLNFVMTFGEHQFFMTGDYVRSDVMDEYADIIANVDVFQFPHHGLQSFAVSSKVFKHVNPKIVLVPANHSNPSSAWAKELGMKAKFYDNRDGNVVIESDGTSLNVHTNVAPGEFATD